MAQDRFQGLRFEQKYIITEEQALQCGAAKYVDGVAASVKTGCPP